MRAKPPARYWVAGTFYCIAALAVIIAGICSFAGGFALFFGDGGNPGLGFVFCLGGVVGLLIPWGFCKLTGWIGHRRFVAAGVGIGIALLVGAIGSFAYINEHTDRGDWGLGGLIVLGYGILMLPFAIAGLGYFLSALFAIGLKPRRTDRPEAPSTMPAWME